MKQEKMDMAKVLAILAQPRQVPPPLENVTRQTIEIPYITSDEKIDTRKVNIFLPDKASKPMPLVYIPHYEMGEDALELRDYLAQGWAVACPTQAPSNANATLAGDNLVFNNAALYTLRQMDEFDKKRIVLVGGSAGGYMALMLTGQNLGLCATIANGPVANAYFNIYYYFPMAQALNMKVLAMTADENDDKKTSTVEVKSKLPAQWEKLKKLADLPIPFIAALIGEFNASPGSYPAAEDTAGWEAVTGVGIAERFSTPVMVNHNPSDVMVPVDQISRRYTYKEPGASLPSDFNAMLPHSFSGKLNKSLEECLPLEDTRTLRIPVPEDAGEESILPYDNAKRFNLNIFDDGPIEGYGTHSSRMDVGRRKDVPYLKEMLEQTTAKTNILVPAMLKFLLLQYLGKSRALPAHTGVDDSVYGSLAVYQKKARGELYAWVADNGEAALRRVFETLMAQETDAEEKDSLKTAMCDIFTQLNQGAFA